MDKYIPFAIYLHRVRMENVMFYLFKLIQFVDWKEFLLPLAPDHMRIVCLCCCSNEQDRVKCMDERVLYTSGATS